MPKTADEMLCDIGIYPEPPTVLFQDDYPVDPKSFHEATERDRLVRAGVDVDHTPVDTFMARPEFGFASMDDDD